MAKPEDKRKSKSRKFFQNSKEYFTQFTENTSLHGIRYLGEQNRSILEKLWWMIIFIGSLYMCIALIFKTYQKWKTSPVIITFAQSPTPIWQIPFPAVTVCPETKSRQSIFNFTDIYHKLLASNVNITLREYEDYQTISLLCENHFQISLEKNKTIGYSFIDLFLKVAPRVHDVLWFCEWKWTNQIENCDSIFTKVLTEEGICYTFNMLDPNDIYRKEVYQNDLENWEHKKRYGWTIETGYTDDARKDTFPRRAQSAGHTGGLTILMRTHTHDLDYICRGPIQGFKIMLHHPGEVPRVASQYFRAPLNQEVVVAIKPDMMTTSEGLRDYDPHRRQCYFSSERYLRFYKNYTQKNCEMECTTNFTLDACGCVAFYMPHDNSTPICGPAHIVCILKAHEELLALQIERGLASKNNQQQVNNNIECDCLPACTSLTYNGETSQADFNWPAYVQAYERKMYEFPPNIQVTQITFFFKEMQFITSERNELLPDFLASCGGLLGLFIGFSCLSVVEVLYFITLRLWCNIKSYGLHHWSGSPRLINNDA